jgi:Ca2+-binding RTX toxin-like protein
MVNVEFLAVTAGHSYTLTLDAATVALGQSLTVQGGTLGAGDSLTLDGSADAGSFTMTAGAGNDSLSGGSAADTFTPGAGTDTVHGNGGNDLILMQGNLTAADAIDGGSGTDTLRLNGDYSAGLTFGATTVTNVETIALIAGNSYSLTIADATVASGASLTVNGLGLGAGDTLTFDGSADLTGGTLVINGGAGNDSLTGGHANDTIRTGAGTDTITGGGGADLIASAGTDSFVYNAVSDSTGAAHDTIRGFDASIDTFRLTGITVSAIDAAVTGGKLDGGQVNPANFDHELAKVIKATQLHTHDAVLFTPDTGTQHGHTFLIVDANGTAGYQAGQDLVIDITGATNLGSLSAASFTS